MNELGAGAAGMRGQVVLLAQAHRQTPPGCITGNADPVDAAADYQKIVHLAHRCLRLGALMSEPKLSCSNIFEHRTLRGREDVRGQCQPRRYENDNEKPIWIRWIYQWRQRAAADA
ncbi:hypothetical protein [Xanthomonas axonopodis]|uniref:hypothetical protein n=1 Tax=Xanthomonas axonopodis TaxID=53413 RepID=UPI0020B86ADE|nr:hypothetical protein [Xanthomonas axonopodis]